MFISAKPCHVRRPKVLGRERNTTVLLEDLLHKPSPLHRGEWFKRIVGVGAMRFISQGECVAQSEDSRGIRLYE